jgi:hypothetical protein
MRFAVCVPLAVPAAGTMAGINSTIDSIHRWRLGRFETCLRCLA